MIVNMIRLFALRATIGFPVRQTIENVRFFSQSNRFLEKIPSPLDTQSSVPQSTIDPNKPWQKQSQHRTLSKFDKRVLVSVGKYKSIDEVPDKVA